MGGIKNKLSKLIYEPPFRKRGVVPVALRVGVPLTSQRYDDSRYNNRISIGGFDRVSKFTKYTSMACLSLAILSTLILNIVSSYSSSNIESNAEPVGTPSILANDSTCNPSNTNAASCISMSISSHSATGDTNDGNLSLSIPQGGGLVAGRHTVKVVTNNVSGGTLDLYTTSSTSLISDDNNATIPSVAGLNNYYSFMTSSQIKDTEWGVAMPNSSYANNESAYNSAEVYELYVDSPGPIKETGAYAGITPRFAGIIGQQQSRDNNNETDTIETWSDSGSYSVDVYYGVRIDNPESFPAGNYSTSVVYAATATLPPTPTNLSVSPTTFEFDSCNDSLITIKGNNLSSAYEVYLQKSGTSDEANRLACTNLNLDSTNNQLTCNIPTSREEVELNTTYDIYVISQAASPGVLKNAFTYTEPATGLSVKSDNENIIVDYDANMIPIKYVDYDGNGGGYWQVVTDKEIEQNTDNWFRYGETPEDKRWANAITVTAEAREAYRKKQTGEDPDPRILPSDNPTGNGEANPEILGYWVYIPRYAYEVQRRDATDKNVDPQNFEIVFETAEDTVKTPAKCTLNTAEKLTADINSSILYQDCIKQLYGDKGLEYPGNDTDLANGKTTWATHPAFTWQYTTEANGFDKTYELNGIWVGKFETTGKISAPTVKPNQHANISEYIGEFYTMSKSIGKEGKCNVGGNTISGIEQDSHNLVTIKSHMLKNSELGAITYLAHSKYGAGINTDLYCESNVQRNSAYPSSSADADGTSSRYGITGCGPAKANETSSRSTYPDGTALGADVIESSTACSTDPELGAKRAYNGELGVLSSTTNTIYGVYGLSGGAGEYVMGNRTTSATETSTAPSWPEVFATPAKEPYVDLYVVTPNGPFGAPASWSYNTSSEQYYNYDVCTFETCGGTATYETTTVQSVSSPYQSWGRTYLSFIDSSIPWFRRGGSSGDSYTSPFYTSNGDGNGYTSSGSRAALLALPAGQ